MANLTGYSGFVCEAASQASISTSYSLAQVVTLDENTGRDANASAIPPSAYLSHLEARFTWNGAGTAPSTATVLLCWDAAGDHAIGGENEIALVAGLTTTAARSGGIGLDVVANRPAVASAGNAIYAFCKHDGTGALLTLDRLRLSWQRGKL